MPLYLVHVGGDQAFPHSGLMASLATSDVHEDKMTAILE